MDEYRDDEEGFVDKCFQEVLVTDHFTLNRMVLHPISLVISFCVFHKCRHKH